VWQTVQGLPNGTVMSIGQTPDGYLWLGKPAGLVLFVEVELIDLVKIRPEALGWHFRYPQGVIPPGYRRQVAE